MTKLSDEFKELNETKFLKIDPAVEYLIRIILFMTHFIKYLKYIIW